MAPPKVYKNFIDGEWVESSTGETFENRNPTDTREVVGLFQRSAKADVDAAVEAARHAFAKWRLVPAPRRAEIMFRTVGDPTVLREAVTTATNGRAEAREVIHIPAVRLTAFDGLPTTAVAFATDIPALGDAWGKPFLIGPGSIHVAHTAEERISKRELSEAVDIYARMASQLLNDWHVSQEQVRA